MAYRTFRMLTTLVPSLKTDFTDLDTVLADAKAVNERNRYVFPTDRKALYREEWFGGSPCLRIRSRKAAHQKNKGLLFLYGGDTLQWKSELGMARAYADRTGMEVWYPIYPPITEVNITVTLAVLYDTYCAMVRRYGAENLAIVGDSMGGLLAAGLLNQINKAGAVVGMPKLLIGNSPAGVPDTPEDWREMARYATRDPLFTLDAFRGIGLLAAHGQDTPKDTYCPARMDFRNAPETYFYFAEELCAGNVRAYRAAYERAGAGARLHVHIQPEMMHGYSCVPVFPESRRCYFEAIRLLNAV